MLRLEQYLESPYEGALRLYDDNPKTLVDINLGRRRLIVSAALVERDELAEILGGEEYAGTISGMFFITKETPEEYRHFAAFHEAAEHAAPRGFDVTGLAKHFQAITVEVGYAKATLSPDDFDKYMEWRKGIERTNFFHLIYNNLIDKVAGRMHEIFESMPKYLTYRGKQLVELIEE